MPLTTEQKATMFALAMRKKYGSPRAAIRALGMDEALLEGGADPDPKSADKGHAMRLIKLLAAKLSPEDWASVQKDFQRMAGVEPEAKDDDPADPYNAQQDFESRILGKSAEDEPPSFRGMPLPGGGKAMDSKPKGDSFADRYPDAARVTIGPYSNMGR